MDPEDPQLHDEFDDKLDYYSGSDSESLAPDSPLKYAQRSPLKSAIDSYLFSPADYRSPEDDYEALSRKKNTTIM